jgi:cytochrome c5
MASEQHGSLIKTPKQLIIVVVLAFIVPIILITLLVTFVAGIQTSGAGSDAMTPEAVANRLRPIGTVAIADASAARTIQSGDAVYKLACAACHAVGAAGAPKTGDNGAWSPRIRQGYDVLVKHAVEGFKAMPAKGGNSDLDPLEVARAVAYMANQSGAKFKEPQAPTSTASAAAPAKGAATAAAPAAPPPAAPAAAVASTAAPAKGAKPDGAKIYAAGCVACHGAGVAGAPKFGDKAAWAPRIKTGVNALTASVVKGKGAMPPKGGLATASEADLHAAVEYMVAAAR